MTDYACGRARELSSLEVDGELNQLDRIRLSVHLSRCVPCRQFRRDVHATTQALRAVPLEQLDHEVALPRRRQIRFRGMQVGVAAAMLVAATVIGILLTPLHTHAGSRAPKRPAGVVGNSQVSETGILRNLHAQLKPEPFGRAGGVQ
ncbi:MAG: zf-HC2 domain-containing protein [Actinomycetota bacterium]|nr:zf-HC2 domain-containing protein [Actinomycetota bacterium]